MKKFLLWCTCVLFAGIFMAGCGTTKPILVRNSAGYDRSVDREEIRALYAKKPEWFGNNWINWKKEKDGNTFYFMAISQRNATDMEKEKKLVWKAADAARETLVDAIGQVARLIRTTASTSLSDVVVDAQDVAEFSSDLYAKSASTFEGLQEFASFTEEWEQSDKEKKITYTNCWTVYSMTNDKIEEARDRLRREGSLKEQEERAFSGMPRQYESAIGVLKNINFFTFTAEYTGRYNELLDINARLDTFSTLKSRVDDIGIRYKDLMSKIGSAIQEYDPTDMQRRLVARITDLEMQIAEKNGEISGLRAVSGRSTGDNGQGYSVSTQTFIVSSPQKPGEKEIVSPNIVAATDMVSNYDYISFRTSKGINEFSRAERRLDAPAVLVAWDDAARYCNWLSRLYGYAPCYTESGGRITGDYDKRKNGYRLPEYNEIEAMLKEGIIDAEEFGQIGIWSSDSEGASSKYRAYRLFGTKIDSVRNKTTGEQVFGTTESDNEIGFRVIRNAK